MKIGMNEVLMKKNSRMMKLKDNPEPATTTPEQPTDQTSAKNMTKMMNFRSLYDTPQQPTTETTENKPAFRGLYDTPQEPAKEPVATLKNMSGINLYRELADNPQEPNGEQNGAQNPSFRGGKMRVVGEKIGPTLDQAGDKVVTFVGNSVGKLAQLAEQHKAMALGLVMLASTLSSCRGFFVQPTDPKSQQYVYVSVTIPEQKDYSSFLQTLITLMNQILAKITELQNDVNANHDEEITEFKKLYAVLSAMQTVGSDVYNKIIDIYNLLVNGAIDLRTFFQDARQYMNDDAQYKQMLISYAQQLASNDLITQQQLNTIINAINNGQLSLDAATAYLAAIGPKLDTIIANQDAQLMQDATHYTNVENSLKKIIKNQNLDRAGDDSTRNEVRQLKADIQNISLKIDSVGGGGITYAQAKELFGDAIDTLTTRANLYDIDEHTVMDEYLYALNGKADLALAFLDAIANGPAGDPQFWVKLEALFDKYTCGCEPDESILNDLTNLTDEATAQRIMQRFEEAKEAKEEKEALKASQSESVSVSVSTPKGATYYGYYFKHVKPTIKVLKSVVDKKPVIDIEDVEQ